MSATEKSHDLLEERFRNLLSTLALNREIIRDCAQCQRGILLEGGRLQTRTHALACSDCPARVDASLSDLREIRETLTAIVFGILPRAGGLSKQSDTFISRLALAGRVLRKLGFSVRPQEKQT